MRYSRFLAWQEAVRAKLAAAGEHEREREFLTELAGLLAEAFALGQLAELWALGGTRERLLLVLTFAGQLRDPLVRLRDGMAGVERRWQHVVPL